MNIFLFLAFLSLSCPFNMPLKFHKTFCLTGKSTFKGYEISSTVFLRNFNILRYLCSEKILKKVYYTFVHSKLKYWVSCWGSMFVSLIILLITIKEILIRIIVKKEGRSESYPPVYQFKIPPLRCMFVFKVLKMFSRISGYQGFIGSKLTLVIGVPLYKLVQGAAQGTFSIFQNPFFRTKTYQLPNKECSGLYIHCFFFVFLKGLTSKDPTR